MDIYTATRKYEAWVAAQTPLIAGDIELKHKRMAEAPFLLFRGTFYRWAQLWPKLCPALATGANILAVGDLHIENFGTWRDSEGRLIWGINDFDEAAVMPYTIDLVRLPTSAIGARAIMPDLELRKRKWLIEAATTMAEATIADWKAWKR
jgi:uncharacterized protein (DUF2252 family)